MTKEKFNKYKIAGFLLVALMVILQSIYAVYAFVDPSSFAALRGTDLVVAGDADWVRIYASRTLFIALIIAYLLYLKDYKILKWAAIFGLVMPVVDTLLAYQAQAEIQVLLKHIGTAVFLLVTFFVLHGLSKSSDPTI